MGAAVASKIRERRARSNPARSNRGRKTGPRMSGVPKSEKKIMRPPP